jgi:selenocysteine lyase/cysteine desulfurase
MQNQRRKFSLAKGVTYLNCAYMSPLLKSVEKAGILGMQGKRNPINISTDDFFSDSARLRTEFAKLINTRNQKRIAIIPSASYGLATVTRNLRLEAGDTIVVAAEQFPSNYYPWQSLCQEKKALLNVVSPPDTLEGRGKHWNEKILESIDSKTRVVALGHVHWADGTRFNLKDIRRRTREVGALLIIDGTQSVGAMPFDVEKIQPDALVCAGYKWLMGPYSIGLAYYGEYFDSGTPVEENWINRLNSEDFAGLVRYQDKYQPGALRYDVGEHSNFILVPMLLEGLRQINQWTPAGIQEYCRKISSSFINRLLEMDFWVENESFRGEHLFGIRFPKGISTGIMKEEIGIKKISVSFRGDSMRVSPHLYNDTSDFDKLLKVIQSAKP